MADKNKKYYVIFGILFGVLIFVWAGFYVQKRINEEIIFTREAYRVRGFGGAREYNDWKIGFLNKNDIVTFYLPAKIELIFLLPKTKYASIDGESNIPNTHTYLD